MDTHNAHAPAGAPIPMRCELLVNGQRHLLQLDPRTTVLDALREHLGLTGTKKGCDHGQCGACTVLLAGRRINSCLTLALMAEGDDITTIEGLPGMEARGREPATAPQQADAGPALHPLQRAFITHDGFQCGYCTPGQICSAVGMLEEARQGMPSHVTADLTQTQPLLSADEIRERMSGNLCRCSAYPNIVDAIAQVAEADQ